VINHKTEVEEKKFVPSHNLKGLNKIPYNIFLISKSNIFSINNAGDIMDKLQGVSFCFFHSIFNPFFLGENENSRNDNTLLYKRCSLVIYHIIHMISW